MLQITLFVAVARLLTILTCCWSSPDDGTPAEWLELEPSSGTVCWLSSFIFDTACDMDNVLCIYAKKCNWFNRTQRRPRGSTRFWLLTTDDRKHKDSCFVFSGFFLILVGGYQAQWIRMRIIRLILAAGNSQTGFSRFPLRKMEQENSISRSHSLFVS